MSRVAFVAARVAAAVVLLLTWGYGVTTYSPFAFDMFVGPRLFPRWPASSCGTTSGTWARSC